MKRIKSDLPSTLRIASFTARGYPLRRGPRCTRRFGISDFMEIRLFLVSSVLPSSETAKVTFGNNLPIFKEASARVDRIVSPSLKTGITTVSRAACEFVSRTCKLLGPLVKQLLHYAPVWFVCREVPVDRLSQSLLEAD